jgi:Family of unknown function (DUF6301)
MPSKQADACRPMVGAVLGTFFAVRLVAAMPSALTPAQLLDICGSSTLSQAAAKGDQLGWQRMSDAQLEEWRTNFMSYNRGSVQVLAWRRGQQGDEASLSFWIAQGPHTHRACSYSTDNPVGLLDALSERFGTPTNLDSYGFGTSASWKRGKTEVSFSRVGSSTVVTIKDFDAREN